MTYTIFDNTYPPPPLPDAAIAAQLAAYAARPPRILPVRYVWIVTNQVSTQAIDFDVLEHARMSVFSAHRLAACNWHVLVLPSDAAHVLIQRTCKAYKIECMIISEVSAWKMASKIVAFNRPDVIMKAKRRKIPAWWNGIPIPIQMRLPLAA